MKSLLLATIILATTPALANERGGGPDTLCVTPSGQLFKTHLEHCPKDSAPLELKHENNQVKGKVLKQPK